MKSSEKEKEKIMGMRRSTSGGHESSSSSSSYIPSLYVITLIFVVMSGLGVFILNYWHSTHCHEAHSQLEIDTLQKILEKRVLQAESEALASSIQLEKFITAIGEELANVEDRELNKLKTEAHKGGENKGNGKRQGQSGEGVGDEQGGLLSYIYHPSGNSAALAKVELALASQPSPLKHRFHLDSKYMQATVLADKIRDTLHMYAMDNSGSISRGRGEGLLPPSQEALAEEEKEVDEVSIEQWDKGGTDTDTESITIAKTKEQVEQARLKREALQDDDFLYIPDAEQQRANNIWSKFSGVSRGSSSSSGSKRKSIKHTAESAAVTRKNCITWRDTYDVRVGVSWGSLPNDLQDTWLTVDCDTMLADLN